MASASPGIRLNQVYANGGWGAGSEPPLYARDFVELFNPTLQPIGMSGWSLQVCAAGGGVWTRLDLPSAVLQPGGSFLISLPGGSAASLAALPPADAAFNVGGIPSGGFKLALVASQATLVGPAPGASDIVDRLSVGSGASSAEGAAFPTPTGSGQRAFGRVDRCIDNNDNATDWRIASVQPRNSGSSPVPCSATPLDAALEATVYVPGDVVPGTIAEVAATITNLGTDPAVLGTGARLLITLPPQWEVLETEPAPSLRTDQRQVVVPLGTLAPAPSVLFAHVRLVAILPGPSTLSLRAIVDQQEPRYENNDVLISAPVQGVPACSLADRVSIGGLRAPDGLLTGDDFVEFVNAFVSGDGLADIVTVGGQPPSDGVVTGDDLVAFINAFADGCP